MKILLDTNLLTRAARLGDPQHALATDALRRLQADGHELCIVPQNLYEFWAVATRGVEHNGLGLSIDEAREEIERIRATFTVLDDGPGLLEQWLALVIQYACHGKPSHDARLVAAMKLNGVNDLLTFNVTDFQRFPWLTLHTPQSIVAKAV